MSAPITQIDGQAARHEPGQPRLRLWPAVVLLGALWALRFVPLIGEPSPSKFFMCLMIGPMAIASLVVLWWLLASRISWRDRLLVCATLLVVGGATVAVSQKTFPGMALIMFGLPALLSVWIGWLVLSYPLRWPLRRAGLIVLLVALGLCLSLLRVDGMDGSFATKISPRWRPTSEDQLLAELGHTPRSKAPATDTQSPTAIRLELQPGDVSGFRGQARDGRLSGVRFATDWDVAPPKELWRCRVGPAWSSFAVVDGYLFTQEQRGDKELVVAYDEASGAERWTHSDGTRFTEVVAGPGPRGTPSFDAGWLYALGANGQLNCLDAATGKLRWSRDVKADSQGKVPQWGYSSSPLVAEGIVSVFAGGEAGKSVLGYRTDDGELAWSAGDGTLSYCSTQRATIGDREQLLIASDAGLAALDPKTGTLLWEHSWPSAGVPRIVQPTVLADGDVLIGTGMGVGTRRISVGGPDAQWPITVRWTTTSFKPYFNDQVVLGDHLYGFDNNILMCVSLADGRPTWRARGYGSGQVLLLVDQALLLVLTETGDVALVAAQPESHREIARFKALEGKTWNHPVVAHGKLFVRNGEEMACFALRPADDAERHAALHTGENDNTLAR